MDRVFSKDDTNLIKGIATCLLLCHHLFLTDKIRFSKFTLAFAVLAKVCVTLFLILSGYGLSESWKRNKYSLKEFYKKNFVKLYTTYWLIWILFVPAGIIFFNRRLNEVYGERIYLKLFINLTGLQDFFGFYGYNATWWFMSLILMLYLIFPLLYKISKAYPIYIIAIGILIVMISDAILFSNFISVYIIYTTSFVVGIISSQKELFVHIANYNICNKIIKFILYIVALGIIIWIRATTVLINVLQIDTIFAYIIILISFEYISKIKYLSKFLIIIGKHSLNIFLFHTFICGYYFSDYIYFFKIPVLIFMVLLLVCLGISLLIEKLKTLLWVGWQSIIKIEKPKEL